MELLQFRTAVVKGENCSVRSTVVYCGLISVSHHVGSSGKDCVCRHFTHSIRKCLVLQLSVDEQGPEVQL